MRKLFALFTMLMFAAPAFAHDHTGYAPMEPFTPFAGHTYRGEGTGPDGKKVVDIAKWEFILGGRALQSTHRLEDGSYGGRTIVFFDEAAKEYIFHYFTTAGFHTTGKAELTEKGFRAVEKVIGHPTYAEVRSEVFLEGENLRTTSQHVTVDGKVSDVEEGFIYKPIDDENVGPLFSGGEHHE